MEKGFKSYKVVQTRLNKGAFSGCSSLESITIPDSVTSIGRWAFGYCTGLTTINYTGTKQQWNSISKGSYWSYGANNYTINYSYVAE